MTLRPPLPAVRARFVVFLSIASVGVAGVGACISRGEPISLRANEPDAGLLPLGTPPPLSQDASLPPALAHSVTSVSPSSGPFKGGTRAIVRGTGFSAGARVWFGDNEVTPGNVLAIDPTRLQVIVPVGSPGAVDVTVRNNDENRTQRTLDAGFVYDPFYADPSSGPTSGGSRITLHGKATDWDSETTVLIDQTPCRVLDVQAAPGETQELECETPPGSLGAKPITTENEGGARRSVLSGFTYSNSDEGFRGGLSGDALESELQVFVLDNLLGSAVDEAQVLLGADPSPESDTLKPTDAQGLVRFSGDLGPVQTITVAKECFHPVTFVDVPVAQLTVYLEPVLSPACVPPQDDPPLVPTGSATVGATVEGELVWTGNREFETESWINVPPPIAETERRVAYLFEAVSNPWRRFALPRAAFAVTEEDISSRGFAFRTDTSVGNLTLYALAGVEDTSENPPRFQAYAMGLVRGVATLPSNTTREVYIAMDNPLDQALHFEIEGPTPTTRGPDRVEVSVAVRMGNEGYAVLPNNRFSTLLPSTGPVSLVGLPPLIGSLSEAEYVTTALAGTGLSGGLPRSELGLFSTSHTAEPVHLTGFVEVPRLNSPAPGADWDGRSLDLDWEAGGAEVNLLTIEVASAGGLVTWRIVAPGQAGELSLPDLRALLPEAALENGALQVLINVAQLDDFNYGNLGYADLAGSAWRASATDQFQIRY